MKSKNEAGHIVDDETTTPDQLVAYLLYALEDVRTLSGRSTLLLPNAIAALAEDTKLANADEIRRSIANDLSIN